MEILERFGIEGKLLLVQFINFAILLAVIWKFILPRLTSLMRERERKVADSLKGAEQARQEIEELQAKQAKEREAARAAAERIVAEAKEAAHESKEQIMAEARKESAALRERTEQALAQERESLRAELRAELAGLTVETTRKILTDVVTPADRKRLVQAAEKHLAKQAKVAKPTKSGGKRG
ncbi:MAG: F0F1 ATP synthase subunit B [Patescibacteria group bacterium]|nr:F0F1 ATP synthase subunit B [Patescibacteria group bacterium]